jgi:hypothetical protein
VFSSSCIYSSCVNFKAYVCAFTPVVFVIVYFGLVLFFSFSIFVRVVPTLLFNEGGVLCRGVLSLIRLYYVILFIDIMSFFRC